MSQPLYTLVQNFSSRIHTYKRRRRFQNLGSNKKLPYQCPSAIYVSICFCARKVITKRSGARRLKCWNGMKYPTNYTSAGVGQHVDCCLNRIRTFPSRCRIVFRYKCHLYIQADTEFFHYFAWHDFCLRRAATIPINQRSPKACSRTVTNAVFATTIIKTWKLKPKMRVICQRPSKKMWNICSNKVILKAGRLWSQIFVFWWSVKTAKYIKRSAGFTVSRSSDHFYKSNIWEGLFPITSFHSDYRVWDFQVLAVLHSNFAPWGIEDVRKTMDCVGTEPILILC